MARAGKVVVRHDSGCEFFLPSGSCDCRHARYVFENGRVLTDDEVVALSLPLVSESPS